MNTFEEYRAKRELSIKEAAALLGVDYLTWWRWERGHKRPARAYLTIIRLTLDNDQAFHELRN